MTTDGPCWRGGDLFEGVTPRCFAPQLRGLRLGPPVRPVVERHEFRGRRELHDGHSHRLTIVATTAPTNAATTHISHGAVCAEHRWDGAWRGHTWQCPHGTTGGGDGSPTLSIARRAVREMSIVYAIATPARRAS